MAAETEQVHTLAAGLAQRLDQLGMSRRELARRTGLSRQTIHNIEHEGAINLKPSTLDALDDALRWTPGTALALTLGRNKTEQIERLLMQYLANIAIHLSSMTTEELELTLVMMEENQLGSRIEHTEEFTSKVGKLVQRLLKEVTILTGETTQDAC